MFSELFLKLFKMFSKFLKLFCKLFQLFSKSRKLFLLGLDIGLQGPRHDPILDPTLFLATLRCPDYSPNLCRTAKAAVISDAVVGGRCSARVRRHDTATSVAETSASNTGKAIAFPAMSCSKASGVWSTNSGTFSAMLSNKSNTG